MKFFLKFGASLCEVVLNSGTKNRTGSLWTGPCQAKPRPASANRHMRFSLL